MKVQHWIVRSVENPQKHGGQQLHVIVFELLNILNLIAFICYFEFNIGQVEY